MSQDAVPLVAYVNGERVELGTAIVRGDGTIEASLDPEKMTPETKRIFDWSGAHSLEISAAPKRPKCSIHNCKMAHPHL